MSGWTQKSKHIGKSLFLVAALAAVVFHTGRLSAQSIGAARLSSVEGQVQIAQAGQQIADQALLNTPLFNGTQISTASDGKAEVQLEDGSVLRLAPNGVLALVALNGSQGAELILTQGLAYFEVPSTVQGQLRVRFGSSLLTAGAGTVLRIRMDTPPGELAVFAGQAHLSIPGGLELDLHDSQSILLNAENVGNYNLADSVEPDSWDAWNQDRDQQLNADAAQQSSAPSTITGDSTANPAWSTLDASGVWYNIPGQGYVWSPYEASAAGWDPYGCGHWMWTPGYGYVWVSCERWGFMPYMCGSWSFFSDFGWGWQPGLGVGCGARWGMGYRGGITLGRIPSGYDPVRRPVGPKRPIGRVPAPIGIDRRGPSDGQGFPARDRNRDLGGGAWHPLRPTTPSGLRPGNTGRDSGRGYGQGFIQEYGQRPSGQLPGQGQRPGQNSSQGLNPGHGTGNGAAPGQGTGPSQGFGTRGGNNGAAVPSHAGAHSVGNVSGPAAVPPSGTQNPGNGQNFVNGGQSQRSGAGARSGYSPAPAGGASSQPAPSQATQQPRMQQQPGQQQPGQQQQRMQPPVQQQQQRFQQPSQPAPQHSAPSSPAPTHSNFGGGAPMHAAPAPAPAPAAHSGGSAPAGGNNRK